MAQRIVIVGAGPGVAAAIKELENRGVTVSVSTPEEVEPRRPAMKTFPIVQLPKLEGQFTPPPTRAERRAANRKKN